MFQFGNPLICSTNIDTQVQLYKYISKNSSDGDWVQTKVCVGGKELCYNGLLLPGCWGTVCLSERGRSQVWLLDHEQEQQGEHGGGGHH